MAHLRLLIVTPVSVTSLKKKLEPLGLHARETLATFMVTVAQSDGVVLPAEVQQLEKIYRSEEHTSELQSLMRISYAVFCLKKKNKHNNEFATQHIRRDM